MILAPGVTSRINHEKPLRLPLFPFLPRPFFPSLSASVDRVRPCQQSCPQQPGARHLVASCMYISGSVPSHLLTLVRRGDSR